MLTTMAWGQNPEVIPEGPAAPKGLGPSAVKIVKPTVQLPASPAPVETAAPTPAATPEHRKAPLPSRHGRLLNQITRSAYNMEGTPYVFGGTSTRGVDCSGFTQRIFALAGIKLKRMADEQYAQGKPVKEPAAGDLVFFSTYLPGPSHVGIYLGGGYFIHAASSRGVTVSSLGESYYKRTYIGARRYF